MKLEMDGNEPLIVLFGLPLLTTGVVLGSMYFGQFNRQVIGPPPIRVEAPQVSPRITAELPAGAIRITNEVPPAQIHEVIKEVVKIPEVTVLNRVESARPPDIQVNLPKPDPVEQRFIAVPMPVPVSVPAPKLETRPTPVSAEPAEEEAPEGKLLPPPKPDLPRASPSTSSSSQNSSSPINRR